MRQICVLWQGTRFEMERLRDFIREGVKKPIESVIMIIPGRGGSAGGDHTLLGF